MEKPQFDESTAPETIPAEKFAPDQAQLVQGPLNNATPPVTESESAIASLTRTQLEHPELQQLATMSGGVSNVGKAAQAIGSNIIKYARPGKQIVTEVPANIAKSPSVRPDWMSGQKTTGGAIDINNIVAGKPKLAEGGDVTESQPVEPNAPDVIPADQFISDEDKYGTAGQQLKTAAEHAASSTTFGLSTKLETALGVKPEDIRARTEENPIAGAAGSIAGLLVPGAPEAKALSLAGKGVVTGLKGIGVSSKIGSAAAKGAVENAMFQAGDEVSRKFTEDPNQTAQTALTDIGLSSILGGALGAGFGSVHELWDHGKASKFTDEMKSRFNEHLTNPDLHTQTADELSKFYSSTQKGSNDLYYGTFDELGNRAPSVKDQAIEKLIPPINDKILDRGVGEVTNLIGDRLQSMKTDADTFQPKFTKALEKDFSEWQAKVDNPTATSNDIFNATQDLKQSLQTRSKIGIPIDNSNPAFDSIKSLKEIASKLRQSLEDADVWGDAGKFQKQTNKAFTDFLPSLKDFNRSFTTNIEGKPVVDPDKVQSYLNSISKDKGSIRAEKLQNYLGAGEKYRDAINNAHESIGAPHPFSPTSVNSANMLTGKLTPGAKAADSVIKHLVSTGPGEAAGAVGGVLAGWPGYMVGKHIAGPVLDSVIPSFIKPLLGSAADGTALKSALDYAAAFAKGANLLSRGVTNVFKSGKEAIPASLMPSEKDRSKLSEHVKTLGSNPEAMLNIGGKTAHYLPNHGQAIAQTAMNAIIYLNSNRPAEAKVSPLDTPNKVEPLFQNKYDRILNVAQQPLIVLNHIKNGTLQLSDVSTIKALYPALYQKMSGDLVTEITNRSEKSEPIPYKTKMSLSLFLGKALDSTMLPQSIIAAQPQPVQQPQQTIKRPAASAKIMEKTNQAALTPDQARSAQRSQVRS